MVSVLKVLLNLQGIFSKPEGTPVCLTVQIFIKENVSYLKLVIRMK
jgi:hypothetical protein